jgi:hypothetical protein
VLLTMCQLHYAATFRCLCERAPYSRAPSPMILRGTPKISIVRRMKAEMADTSRQNS